MSWRSREFCCHGCVPSWHVLSLYRSGASLWSIGWTLHSSDSPSPPLPLHFPIPTPSFPPPFPLFLKDTINIFVFVERGMYFFFLSRRDDITVRRGFVLCFRVAIQYLFVLTGGKVFFLKIRFFSNSFTKMSADTDRSLLVASRNFENRLGLRHTYDRNFDKISQIPSSALFITLTLCFSPPTVITYLLTYLLT